MFIFFQHDLNLFISGSVEPGEKGTNYSLLQTMTNHTVQEKDTLVHATDTKRNTNTNVTNGDQIIHANGEEYKKVTKLNIETAV